MTVCAVYGYNMDSIIHRISMFLFPKDLKRRKYGFNVLNRGRTATTNFIPKSHSKICFKHFDDNQFLISPKLAEAAGYKNFRLRLKSDAVPTVFDFKNRRNGTLKGSNFEKSIAKKKVQHVVLVCRFRFTFNEIIFWVIFIRDY